MKLSFTKHAREKLSVRQVGLKTVKEVLSNPHRRFYDTITGSEVAAKSLTLRGQATTLVVIYLHRGNEYRVVTVYPTKRFGDEADGKVKSGRWILRKRSGA